MLEVDRNTTTSSTSSTRRNTVELDDVTVLGDCLVDLHLVNME